MLPREGFYVDPLAKLLRWTLFNQLLTLPAWALLYSSRYVLASEPTEKATLGIVSTLMTFLLVLSSYGLWLSFNTYMTVGLLNNWVGDDSWDWGKEIVVVTGGSSGIGASIVQQLVDRNPGTSVVVVDYSPLTYAVPAGSKLHYYQADLSMIDAIRKVCATIRTEVGHPSVLINNAGLLRGRTVMEGTYSDVEITIKTNLIAPFLLAKEFLPSMVKKNHGHIVGISSLSAIISPAFLADYAATKAGMLALQEVSIETTSAYLPLLIHCFTTDSSAGTQILSPCSQSASLDSGPQLHPNTNVQGQDQVATFSLTFDTCRHRWRSHLRRSIQRPFPDAVAAGYSEVLCIHCRSCPLLLSWLPLLAYNVAVGKQMSWTY